MPIRYLSGLSVDSTVLVVDAANDRVGIGTASPGAQLHLQSSSPEILLYNTTTAGGTLNFVDQAWQSQIVGIQGNLLFKTGGTTERIRITNDGNVGIGTTSPNYKLDVNGSINIYSGNSLRWGSGDVEILNSGYSMLFSTYTGSALTEKMRITSGGNVGIGTTAPGFKLNVVGGNGNQLGLDNAGERFTQISFLESGSQNSAIWLDGTDNMFDIYANTSHGIRLKTGGDNTRLTVASGGNVLIGATTDAGFKLQVNGTSAVMGGNQLRLYRTDNATYGSIQYLTGAGGFKFDDVNGDGYTFAQGANVRLSIGTTGGIRFNAYGSGSFTGTVAYNLAVDSSGNIIETAGGVVDGSGTANYVTKWQDANTVTNSIIRDDGTTVGIGQAPAAAKVSVNGSLNAGGRYLYHNFQSSLDTTGVVVAGLSVSTNGDSAFFTFEAGAGNGHYQRIVWSCYNAAGDWNVVKVIDEGSNGFDVVASASSGATITFTWKSRSGTIYYTPRLIITGVGSINTSYL